MAEKEDKKKSYWESINRTPKQSKEESPSEKPNIPEYAKRKIESAKASFETKKEKPEESKKPDIIATHTVESGETLSHIALKYYKHATPPYWKYLLEHNGEVLKGNERNLRKGMEIVIPELPKDLKD